MPTNATNNGPDNKHIVPKLTLVNPIPKPSKPIEYSMGCLVTRIRPPVSPSSLSWKSNGHLAFPVSNE